MRSDSYEELEVLDAPKFDAERFMNTMDGEVLKQLMRAWMDGLLTLDRAPELLQTGSYFHSISRICVEISYLFELLARYTFPSLKEFVRQFGIYEEMQCAIYKVWTNRVHSSLRGARSQTGFLVKLFF